MNSFDIITVGSAIIDAFLQIHDADVHCRYDEEKCELCVKHGEKIILERCDFVLGGNACNVTVGVSRMGLATSLCAEIGADEFSQKIINGLKKERVDLTFLQQTEGASSSFAIGINFKGERTLFVEHIKRKHDFHFDTVSSKWVFLTSLGEEWEGAYANVLQFVKNSGSKLAFNPGSHQLEKGVESFLDVLKATDILFVNKEEAIRILNFKFSILNENDNNKIIKQILSELRGLGTKVVVVTDGEHGSYSIDEQGNILHLEIFETSVIERTGAGDAYTAGFLGSIMQGLQVSESMRWGGVNAASVVGQIGAQAGLLSLDEVKKKLDAHPEFRAKEI